MEGRITPEYIRKLKTGEIFVFGSNEAGRHGKGAAKQALKWGAVYFQGIGLFGQTYAIPTKNKKIKTLPIVCIAVYVYQFIEFAIANPDLTFLVVPIGTMLAGYKPEDIAPLFERAIPIKNIHLPQSFWDILNPPKDKIIKQAKLL